jgi:hypothetical protein
MKTLTLRLDEEQVSMLGLVADADSMTVSDAIRAAIDAHIEARRRDKEFVERLHRRMEEHRDILDRLAR